LIRNNQSALRNFSFFAIRLPPFAICFFAFRNFSWCLPKIMGRHRGLPLQRICSHEHGSQWQCHDNVRHRFQTHAQHQANPL
jgi:hypothetical protein